MKQELFGELLSKYINAGKIALESNHFELAELLGDTPHTWLEFLNTPEAKEYIDTQHFAIISATRAKMLMNANDNRSTGAAQLFSGINAYFEDMKKKDRNGPIFIYTYVPLNSEQEKASNIRIEKKDIFRKI